MTWLTSMRIAPTLLVALLLSLPPSQAQAEEVVARSTPHGLAWLSMPAIKPAERHPVVLVLPDRLGRDGREDPYVDLLLEAGIAVLMLDLGATESLDAPLDPWELRNIVRDIAPVGLDDGRIGLLGFGWGARVVLAVSPTMATAALYPSCAGLPSLGRDVRTLILHPADPAEALECRRASQHAEALQGATHGWDCGQGLWLGTTSRLPHPDGSGRRLSSRSDPWATQEAAGRVARHFAHAFTLQARE